MTSKTIKNLSCFLPCCCKSRGCHVDPLWRGKLALFLSFFVVLLGMALPGTSHAALRSGNAFESDSADVSLPWQVTADSLFYDQEADHYVAKGHVVVVKKKMRLSGDFVQLNHKTGQALAIGNAVLSDGEDILTGERIRFDLKNETGSAYHGTVFLKQNHFYIRGDKIQKTGEKTYSAQSASISTCDGENPDWKVTARNVSVALEGYGSAIHSTLWLKKVPVLYTPYFIFPAKTKRQSGFLPPRLRVSDRKGTEYEQPYFWAINDNSDATLYLDHMDRRGEKFGLEYRYVLSHLSKGALMGDFLNDRQADDGTEDSSDRWGYKDDVYLRPNHDRYWFRMKHDQALPWDFFAKLDLDMVSDQDYLVEFKSGYNGFDETNHYFQTVFGRGVDDYTDTTRLNRLNLNRAWDRSSLNIEGRWYDDVLFRRHSDPEDLDLTLHRLPFVEYDVSKGQFSDTPFYYDLSSDYIRFYRKDGLRGHRVDVYPKAYLPVKLNNYLSLEPFVGLRETFWHIDQYETEKEGQDSTQLRDLYDTGINLSTELYRIYNTGGKTLDKIRHSILPKITYRYLPEKEQDQYPKFDGVDRIGRVNQVGYSLTNTFTSRSLKKTPNTEIPQYLYREFARLSVNQSYNIYEATDEDIEEKEPFSNINGQLTLSPMDYISVDADAQWSVYEHDWMSYNTQCKVSDYRGDSFHVEYRYRRDSAESKSDGKESIYTRLYANLFEGFSAFWDHERNLYDKEDIKTGIGVIYKAQCWSIDFRYTDEFEDRAYSVMINLYGLGGFGSSIGTEKQETE